MLEIVEVVRTEPLWGMKLFYLSTLPEEFFDWTGAVVL